MIRDAGEADLAALAEAMVRIQNDHVREIPDVYRHFSVGEARAHLAPLLPRTETHLRVLESDGQVVAHAITRIEARPETLFEHSRKVAYLAQIEVATEFRRRGYGWRLLEDFRQIGADERADRLVLDVWSFNESAQSLFRAAGWKEFGSKLAIFLNKKLDGE